MRSSSSQTPSSDAKCQMFCIFILLSHTQVPVTANILSMLCIMRVKPIHPAHTAGLREVCLPWGTPRLCAVLWWRQIRPLGWCPAHTASHKWTETPCPAQCSTTVRFPAGLWKRRHKRSHCGDQHRLITPAVWNQRRWCVFTLQKRSLPSMVSRTAFRFAFAALAMVFNDPSLLSLADLNPV